MNEKHYKVRTSWFRPYSEVRTLCYTCMKAIVNWLLSARFLFQKQSMQTQHAHRKAL
jgi:hypothetical protein